MVVDLESTWQNGLDKQPLNVWNKTPSIKCFAYSEELWQWPHPVLWYWNNEIPELKQLGQESAEKKGLPDALLVGGVWKPAVSKRVQWCNLASYPGRTWEEKNFHMDKLRNATILRNYSRIGCVCASSRYQAIYSPPTRPGYETRCNYNSQEHKIKKFI